jgi:hypothetical protein
VGVDEFIRSRATGSSVIFRSAQNIKKSSIREAWPKFTGQNAFTESLARDLRHYRRATLSPLRRRHQHTTAVGSQLPYRHRINVEGHAQLCVRRPRPPVPIACKYEKAQGRSMRTSVASINTASQKGYFRGGIVSRHHGGYCIDPTSASRNMRSVGRSRGCRPWTATFCALRVRDAAHGNPAGRSHR